MKIIEQFIVERPLLFLSLVLWVLVWKGLALWKSARREEKWWFVALLFINTLGFLEILYLFVFSRKNKVEEETEQEDAV